jgi:heme-degrading monooxygenase HmoA
MATGILVPAIDFSGFAEDEFNDWYDLEHIPERLRVPGFLACERWIGVNNPKISVATYELDDIDALNSAAYHAIGNHAGGGANLSIWSKRVTAHVKMTMRFEGEQISSAGSSAPKDAPALLLNAMNVAPENEHDFNEWYEREHLPALATVPGFLCARRYRGSETSTQRYLVLYYVASPAVPDSTAWKEAANTPWTERMRQHFRDRQRIACRRYYRAS